MRLKRSWFKRNFGWIADDFRHLAYQLRQPETWMFLTILGIFATIAFFGFQLALKMDFTMRLRHLTETACSEIGNLPTAILFFGTTFFVLTMIMVFGEFAHYLDYKRRNALALARGAAFHCAGWSFFSLVIGLGMVLFLQSQCI